jgi:hypothetical protein
MGKKSDAPSWFKEACASYRAMRGKGDLAASEMFELLADDIQTRHEAGDPFGRSLWVGFIIGYEGNLTKSQADAAAEEWALIQATGHLQTELFPREVLDKLGLPPVLDLGGFGKKLLAADACHGDMLKYRQELERKQKSWDTSLEKQIIAADRALEILPADNSKTLRQIVRDPGEHGYGTGTQ